MAEFTLLQYMLEDAHISCQLHWSMPCCGPRHAKRSAAAALLRYCYAATTDNLAVG